MGKSKKNMYWFWQIAPIWNMHEWTLISIRKFISVFSEFTVCVCPRGWKVYVAIISSTRTVCSSLPRSVSTSFAKVLKEVSRVLAYYTHCHHPHCTFHIKVNLIELVRCERVKSSMQIKHNAILHWAEEVLVRCSAGKLLTFRSY